MSFRTKELEGQRYSALFDEKRHPHSRHLLVKEEGEAIERWLRVIDHLVSDNDATDYSKVIPDVFAVIANLEQNPVRFRIEPVAQRHQMVSGSLALLLFIGLQFPLGSRAVATIGDEVL